MNSLLQTRVQELKSRTASTCLGMRKTRGESEFSLSRRFMVSRMSMALSRRYVSTSRRLWDRPPAPSSVGRLLDLCRAHHPPSPPLLPGRAADDDEDDAIIIILGDDDDDDVSIPVVVDVDDDDGGDDDAVAA